MAENTKIAWTDKTWNPWQGCSKVSPGCQNCYMFRDKKRYGQDPTTVIRSKDRTFDRPLHWKDPAKVFVCSWSDFFIEDADPWRSDAWDIIRNSPHLTFQILTKRPQNVKDKLPSDWPLPNVWLGVTAENQEMAEERIPVLMDIPAVVRFVSVEPMLGPIYIEGLLHVGMHITDLKISWLICGGESGPNSRPMENWWVENLKLDCSINGVAFFMKQMSGNTKKQLEDIPDYLNVREFPITD